MRVTPEASDPGTVHAWRIAEREYDRQEQRRGRRHAYERIDAARTALVVIDMVPFFVGQPGFRTGIVDNIERLATSLRAAGGSVAWVLPGAELSPIADEFYGSEVSEMFRRCGGQGPLAGRLWPAFTVQPGDLLVEKSAPSAFFPGRSPLPHLLSDRGIETVVITGTVTNVCCESSARDAATLGYRVVFVADGTATGDDAVHNATLHTVYRSFGDVRPTIEVVALIEDSTAPSARGADRHR